MAPRLKAVNNAKTTLTSSISAGDTTFQVDDSSTFPDEGPFRITIDAEVMEVGAINKVTHTFSNVQRGLEGTMSAAHDSGAEVTMRFTAGMHAELAGVKHDHTGADEVQVPTGGIKDGAVTTPKIADGAVTSDKLDAKAVTAGKIDDDAIDSVDLIDEEIRTTPGGTEGECIAVTDADGKVGHAKAADDADTVDGKHATDQANQIALYDANRRVYDSNRLGGRQAGDRKSTRLNSSHVKISYAVFCLK